MPIHTPTPSPETVLPAGPATYVRLSSLITIIILLMNNSNDTNNNDNDNNTSSNIYYAT